MSSWIVRAGAVLALIAGAWACDEPATDDTLDVSTVLRGDTAGFARALSAREFSFPADHGPHPEFKTEWWYYTGNLESESGRRFGFQLTFFRSALAPPGTATAGGAGSAWRTDDVYMAHFAVSDVDDGEFYTFERFARAAVGLAGARATPFRVWLERWTAEDARDGDGTTGGTVPPMRIAAGENGIAIDLRLQATKPPVLQGDAGLSQKGRESGNASYYYSLSRMEAGGVVRIGEVQHRVSGTAWMDREWSTSVLETDQVGWDWFALQLHDTTEVMVYRLRRRDGTPDPHSRGVFIDAGGAKHDFTPAKFELEVQDTWESPDGVTYPSGWRLAIPALELDVSVTPLLRGQELRLSFRYWEGAVRVRGTRAGRPLSGTGYVELTGYGTSDPRP